MFENFFGGALGGVVVVIAAFIAADSAEKAERELEAEMADRIEKVRMELCHEVGFVWELGDWSYVHDRHELGWCNTEKRRVEN